MKVGPFLLMAGALSAEDATIEAWEEGASQVMAMQRNVNWWIGDMVVFGEARWGDEFWQVVPMDASVSLLERCAGVSKKYPPGERFPSLSWTHHVHALRVKDKVARRSVLRHAEREGMDSEEFRVFISERFDG
jgi:hypothetical protein